MSSDDHEYFSSFLRFLNMMAGVMIPILGGARKVATGRKYCTSIVPARDLGRSAPRHPLTHPVFCVIAFVYIIFVFLLITHK